MPPDSLPITESPKGLSFAVRISPRAARTQIVGVENGACKIRLQAPPVEGKANEALVEYLARALGVPRSSIEIVTGERARSKVIRVRGTTRERIYELVRTEPPRRQG